MLALAVLWLAATPVSADVVVHSTQTVTLTETILHARPDYEEVQRMSCLAAAKKGIPASLASIQAVDPSKMDETFLSKYYDDGGPSKVAEWPDTDKLVAAVGSLPRAARKNKQGKVVPIVSRAEQKRIAALAVDIAEEYDLNPGLLLSFIGQESAFDRKARGKLGEIGLLQIKPVTAAVILRRWNPTVKLTQKKIVRILEDPEQNLRIGSEVLVELREHLTPLAEKRHVDMKKVLAAGHNAGEHNVKVTLARYKRTPKATKTYEKQLLAKYTRLKKQVQKDD